MRDLKAYMISRHDLDLILIKTFKAALQAMIKIQGFLKGICPRLTLGTIKLHYLTMIDFYLASTIIERF